MFFLGIFLKSGGGEGGRSGIPKSYVKFWWYFFFGSESPTFFWLKVTFLFQNVPRGGGGPPV